MFGSGRLRWSLTELDAQFILAERLGFASDYAAFADEILRVGRLLNAQLVALRR